LTSTFTLLARVNALALLLLGSFSSVPSSMNGLIRVLLILVLLDARTASALDPTRHITELVHRVWDRKSGVPADISALAQSTDGYLWVGSLRGLYRFDGTQFQKFEPESGVPLPSHEINSVFAVPGDKLWIGFRTGGASVLEAGKLINYSSVDGLPEGRVNGFAQDRNGRVWVATRGGLAFFDGDRWRTVGKDFNFVGSGAQAVFVDHLGALWVAGEHRIAVLNPGSSKFELADEPYNGQVYQLAESPDGTMWMAETTRAVQPLKRPGEATSYRGLTKDDCQSRFPDTYKTEPRCRRPDDLEVRVGSVALLFDQNGGFWITTLGDGLRRAPYPLQLRKRPIDEYSEELEHFTSKDGLSSDYNTTILEDREGNIWVSTRDGIDQFRNSDLAPVTIAGAMGVSIVPGDNGYVVALAGNGGHMFRFHDAHNKIAVANTDTLMHSLYRDLFGSIWGVGRWTGCRFVGDECANRWKAPGEKVGLSWSSPWLLAVDGKHGRWAYVAQEGLFAFENGRWSRFSGNPSAPTDAIPTTQYTDAAGRIWFGFQDGRLLTVKDGVVHLYSSEDGLTLGETKAIDSAGTYVWVGGERGLVLLRGSHFTAVLPYDIPTFNSVSGIVEADDGSLWLNESRGVLRISPSEVSAILLDSSHRAHYDVLNGLPEATEQFASLPTAIRGTDGRLWFATTNGAAWVDPRHVYRNNVPPPVVIQSIVADGRTLSSSGKLELPSRTINIQIAYSALSLSVPERVQFRYRLKGLDHEWQNVGTRRTAYYTRLPPGSYDFQVIASNDAGVWNSVGAQLPIRIIPAWYQTRWFYVLGALLVTATLAALYRFRIAQVHADTRRQLEARLSERDRIARDLHDTLLQGMQGLIWRFQSDANRIPPDQPARKLMEQSLDRADKLLEESRDKVKDLRPAAASEAVDFTQALAAECEQLAQLQPIKFQVSVQGTPRELHPIVHEEGLMIAREALSNAFRHSGANDIEVEVTFGKATFHLRVRDDGRGISPSVLEAGGKPGHFGLMGLRERAKKLGGHLEIWSKPDAGTEIDLRVPAKLAYRRSQSGRVRSLFERFRSSNSPH
jgi:signal transduction histidine kinase/ligand-binding sensor domain-containing protein